MLGYGHDESAPTPGGMFRNPFRGCTWVYCGVFCGVSWVGVTLLVNRSQRCCRPFAALSQSVRSCRGPIYRARIYVNAHVMGRGNVRAVK